MFKNPASCSFLLIQTVVLCTRTHMYGYAACLADGRSLLFSSLIIFDGYDKEKERKEEKMPENGIGGLFGMTLRNPQRQPLAQRSLREQSTLFALSAIASRIIDHVGQPTVETNKRLAANHKNSGDSPE